MSQDDDDENQRILDELFSRPRDPDYFLEDISNLQAQNGQQGQHQVPYQDFLRFLPSDFTVRQDSQAVRENLNSMYTIPEAGAVADVTALVGNAGSRAAGQVPPAVPSTVLTDLNVDSGVASTVDASNFGIIFHDDNGQSSAPQAMLPAHAQQQPHLENIQQPSIGDELASVSEKMQHFNPVPTSSGFQPIPLPPHGLSDHETQSGDAAIHLLSEIPPTVHPTLASSMNVLGDDGYNNNDNENGNGNKNGNTGDNDSNNISGEGNTNVDTDLNFSVFPVNPYNNADNNNGCSNDNPPIGGNPAVENPLSNASLNPNFIENLQNIHPSFFQGVPGVQNIYSCGIGLSEPPPFTSNPWPSGNGFPESSSFPTDAFGRVNLQPGSAVTPPVASQLTAPISNQPQSVFSTVTFPTRTPDPRFMVRRGRLRTLRRVNASADFSNGATKRLRRAPSIANVSDASKPTVPLTNEEKLRRKRDFHNAVERRRRELIKDCIKNLGSLVPSDILNLDPGGKQTKPNKGLILNKVVEYIHYLKKVSEMQDERQKEMSAKIEELKRLLGDVDEQDIPHRGIWDQPRVLFGRTSRV